MRLPDKVTTAQNGKAIAGRPLRRSHGHYAYWPGRLPGEFLLHLPPAGQVELMALRWYNPTTHQWNIDFATPKRGALGIPGVGEFRNGRGDFYDQESINGKTILVRFSLWGITPDTAQSEQAIFRGRR